MKALLVGYYGAGNLGDEILLAACLKFLSECTSVSSVCVLSENPEKTSEQFSERFFKREFKALNKFLIHDLLLGISECDSVIFGGGSIFQSVTSFKSLFYYSCVLLWAKLLRKKIILLSQGIGPFKHIFSEYLAKMCFRSANFVGLREGEGNLYFAKKWNIKNFTCTYDLAWSFDYENENKSKNEKQDSLIISLRTLPELNTEKIQMLVNFVTQNFNDWEIQLLAFQNTDIPAIEKFINLMPEPVQEKIKITELYSLDDFERVGKSVFQKSKLALCTRFHCAILSVLYNVFPIGISYDPKVKDLFKELCLESFDIDELHKINKNICQELSHNDKINKIRLLQKERLEALKILIDEEGF